MPLATVDGICDPSACGSITQSDPKTANHHTTVLSDGCNAAGYCQVVDTPTSVSGLAVDAYDTGEARTRSDPGGLSRWELQDVPGVSTIMMRYDLSYEDAWHVRSVMLQLEATKGALNDFNDFLEHPLYRQAIRDGASLTDFGDVKVLLTGTDFAGGNQSRTWAAGGLLVPFAGGKLLKKLFKRTPSVATNTIPTHHRLRHWLPREHRFAQR